MRNSHYDVLGRFVPSLYNDVSIANEIRKWLSDRRIGADKIEVLRNHRCTDVTRCWHRDGLGKYHKQVRTFMPDGSVRLDSSKTPSIQWMIVWSNDSPTEICDADYYRYTPNPFDVVMLNNIVLWHRAPAVIAADRWFIRIPNPVQKS